jgi:hypothetical protein
MNTHLGVGPQFLGMGITIFRTVQMLSDGMRVQLDFYLVLMAGHKILLRYGNADSV